jgi:hypothetical protein
MTPDQRDEITASVAAHQDLGPRYDAAVAEGLVERIGEEIDKRVDARLRTMNQRRRQRRRSDPDGAADLDGDRGDQRRQRASPLAAGR